MKTRAIKMLFIKYFKPIVLNTRFSYFLDGIPLCTHTSKAYVSIDVHNVMYVCMHVAQYINIRTVSS